MAAQFISHMTQSGERWDSLAWRYYGDATLYAPIIQANPAVPIEAVFEVGLSIAVPLLVVNEAVRETANLPPWKR
jgi:phage tail protein X